jgi:hypothetical protein
MRKDAGSRRNAKNGAPAGWLRHKAAIQAMAALFFSFYGRDGNQMDVIFHFFKNPLRVFSANLRYDD